MQWILHAGTLQPQSPSFTWGVRLHGVGIAQVCLDSFPGLGLGRVLGLGGHHCCQIHPTPGLDLNPLSRLPILPCPVAGWFHPPPPVPSLLLADLWSQVLGSHWHRWGAPCPGSPCLSALVQGSLVTATRQSALGQPCRTGLPVMDSSAGGLQAMLLLIQISVSLLTQQPPKGKVQECRRENLTH